MTTGKGMSALRWTRRAFGGTLGAAGAATLLPAALPSIAHANAVTSPAGAVGGLRVLPPAEAPYDATGRRELALDALAYYVRQQGNFLGRSTFQLPAAPWFGGYVDATSRYAWDMPVSAGLPLYLLAFADDSGQFDPSQTTITVNGETVPNLAAYLHNGVAAVSYGHMRDFAVLDLVFAPPAPGRYHLEVRTRLSHYAPVASPGTPWPDETVLAYDLSVGSPDALNPRPMRDPAGNVYLFAGSDLRRVPDPATFDALGYSGQTMLNVSGGFVAAVPQGDDLPALRDGLVLRTTVGNQMFRLQGGKRQLIANSASVANEDVRQVEPAVLQSIPPVLQDDMLLKGLAVDIFHVDRGTLRKIPNVDWAQDHNLDAGDIVYVPDRLVATLPQNSPEWRMPSGTFSDRTFDSQVLGRPMVYRVYLPSGYDHPENAGRRYPVIYRLHGFSGRYDEWDGYGVSEVANALVADGKFPDTIMVMPQGGLGYWMNQDGGVAWADYVAKDFVAYVDATYRTIPRREARAVGGLSMGAHGAMQLAMNYPDVFGIAGVHSPSIRGLDSAPAFFGTGDSFARHDPISLVQNARLNNPPQIWIDAGQDDFWRPSAQALHDALQTKGWAHEWHVYPGGHDGWYWGDHLWDYLPYYATAFQKNGVPVTFTRP